MLTLARVLAEVQVVDRIWPLVFGGACCVAAACLSAAALSPRVRASVRWGEDGRGPRISAAGAGALAACAFCFALRLFAQAFAWIAATRFLFWLLLASIFVAACVAIRDYSRDRERI